MCQGVIQSDFCAYNRKSEESSRTDDDSVDTRDGDSRPEGRFRPSNLGQRNYGSLDRAWLLSDNITKLRLAPNAVAVSNISHLSKPVEDRHPQP